MPVTRFVLHLSLEQVMRYYQGQASSVRVKDSRGQWVQFPAYFLRQIVDRDGVHGTFEIKYLSSGQCVSLRRID